MAKPINSDKNNLIFGEGSGRIACLFHDGSSAVSGYIVKQLGTSRFRVTDNGTDFYTCRLAKTSGEIDSESLSAGLMTIKAFATGGSASLTARYGVATTAINAGGSGYVTGNTITVALGGGTAVTLTVTASAGAITALAITNAGDGPTLPGVLSSTVRRLTQASSHFTTNGSGTGAVIDLTFKVTSIVVNDGGTGYTAGQAVTFTGLVGGTPAATIGTVDSNGTITAMTVGTASTGIHTAATSLSLGTTTKYVKYLYATRMYAIDGTRLPWGLVPAVNGKCKLGTQA